LPCFRGRDTACLSFPSNATVSRNSCRHHGRQLLTFIGTSLLFRALRRQKRPWTNQLESQIVARFVSADTSAEVVRQRCLLVPRCSTDIDVNYQSPRNGLLQACNKRRPVLR